MDAGWFTGSTLNFAAHLTRHTGQRAAIIFCGENGARRKISFDQLRESVGAVAAGLRDAGVGFGDRVGGFLPNCPEAVIAMLATASIGATWSSCSPDFGVNGVVDRFGQIEPKVLFATDGYYYNGKRIDSLPVVAGIVESIPSIEATVIAPVLADGPDAFPDTAFVTWSDFQKPGAQLSVRRGTVQSSAVHHVFIGHDGRAKVHCARSRRNPVAAPQRTRSSYGRFG